MDSKDKVLRLMNQINRSNEIGIPQELAMKVLTKTSQEDEWVADLIHETVSTTGETSAKALLRLLYLMGIGTIIEGRMN